MDGEIVVCPWHGLEFNIIDGHAVMAYPNKHVPTVRGHGVEGQQVKVIL